MDAPIGHDSGDDPSNPQWRAAQRRYGGVARAVKREGE